MADNTPLGQWSGSDATKQLEETIKRLQLENSNQQTTMLNWTKLAVVFAFGTLVLSLIQVLHSR